MVSFGLSTLIRLLYYDILKIRESAKNAAIPAKAAVDVGSEDVAEGPDVGLTAAICAATVCVTVVASS